MKAATKARSKGRTGTRPTSPRPVNPNSKRGRTMAREAQRRRTRWFWVGAVAVVVALFAAAVFFGGGQDSSATKVEQTRPISASGDALPPLMDPDDAVGMKSPEIAGESFSGEAVSITSDGTPKMIIFLAHWCPHCQAEVPKLQSWIDQSGFPEGVDVVSVVTSTDPNQPNYPPSEWLTREGWTVPVVVDDASSSGAERFGVNGYPFFVFVDREGRVQHRASGELAVEHIEEILATLRS